MSPILQDLLIAAALLVALLTAFEVGYRAGGGAPGEGNTRASGQIGAIQGAVLGLLGLLLALSFASAASRFIERQDLIVQEANAIGTAYLRADLIDDPHRTSLRAALKRYTERRIVASQHVRSGLSPEVGAEFESLHTEIWNAASQGALARPQTMQVVIPAMNDVIDMHSTRLGAARRHLPILVLVLLIACSILATGVIGYGSGVSGHRRSPMTVPLSLLIGMSLWLTIDLDHPRAGLLQLSDAPLEALKFDRGP